MWCTPSCGRGLRWLGCQRGPRGGGLRSPPALTRAASHTAAHVPVLAALGPSLRADTPACSGVPRRRHLQALPDRPGAHPPGACSAPASPSHGLSVASSQPWPHQGTKGHSPASSPGSAPPGWMATWPGQGRFSPQHSGHETSTHSMGTLLSSTPTTQHACPDPRRGLGRQRSGPCPPWTRLLRRIE